MAIPLTAQQLTGQDSSHLCDLGGGQQLQAPAAAAFELLRMDAREAGFELAIASSFRSFERQCEIWNGKARGERPVYGDADERVLLGQLPHAERVHAILRFSALPGTSRHHWGSDLDVFDAAAVAPGYQLQLCAAEVAPGGLFDPLHRWLDERMAADQSQGFFRPYAADNGGVAPERWHLSHAPCATPCEAQCNPGLLASVLAVADIELWEEVRNHLNTLCQRYVAVPRDWCPSLYYR